jgi:hypothetical protein
MNHKKGQVTLFIILGLIVILIIVLAVYLIKEKEKIIDDDTYEENYNARLAPIRQDIIYCIESLGKEAIKKVGETGGYTELNPLEYRYNSHNAYENNALELFDKSGVILPYWSHIPENPDCTTCTYAFDFPLLEGSSNSIASSLEAYIENNLVSCLDNFSAYKFDLDVLYEELPDCKVQIKEKNVFFGVNWNIDVKFPDGAIHGMSKYPANINVRLKDMYNYAVSILFQMEMMENSRAFEYFTKDIITFLSFGGEDSDIPPISGPIVMEASAPTMWIEMNVENILKNAVAETTPYMQIGGTKDSFLLFTESSIESNFYANFQNKVYYNDDFQENVRVRFNYYPIWPFYVNVEPSNGPIIMPEQSSIVDIWLLKLSMTKYNFFYDVSYPVLVTLEDDDAFEGEGFIFNFPFEVNIKDNEPYSNETIDMKNLMANEPEEDEFGLGQRTINVTLNVVDGFTQLPLEDITVWYTCINQDYVVGRSKIKLPNPNAMIYSALPPCLGGYFKVAEIGYSESVEYEDMALDDSNNNMPPIFVYPAKEIQIELKKRIFEPTAEVKMIHDAKTEELLTEATIDRKWSLGSPEASTSLLEIDEEVSVIFSEIRNDGGIGNAFVYSSNESSNIIKLVPGKYSVQVISMQQMGEGRSMLNYTIPERKSRIEGEIITVNETVIDNTMYLGGINIDDETIGYLEVTPEDLQKSYITVYFPGYRLTDIKYVEDLGVLGMIANVTESHPTYFKPVFE